MVSLKKTLYTAEAIAEGGRMGHARTNDDRLVIKLDVPSEMGGAGGPGTNPEQLFAAGYAACFQSVLMRLASDHGGLIEQSRVTCRVSIGPVSGGGFGLAVALDLDAPDLSRDDAAELMIRAHETCPYSRATRGNVAVELAVAGERIELQPHLSSSSRISGG